MVIRDFHLNDSEGNLTTNKLLYYKLQSRERQIETRQVGTCFVCQDRQRGTGRKLLTVHQSRLTC